MPGLEEPFWTGFKMPAFDAGLIVPVLFFSVPVILATRRIYQFLKPTPPANTYNPETGIGRGAPGIVTGTKRVALPLHIVARIKCGEEVSAEEITEALELEREKLEREERRKLEEEERQKAGIKTLKVPESVDEDWLPAGATVVGGQRNTRRRK